MKSSPNDPTAIERDHAPKPKPAASTAARTPLKDDGSKWLRDALANATEGNRNDVGFCLAGQLRDNRVANAEAIMREYARQCPQGSTPYTEREAIASLHSALASSARPPAVSAAKRTGGAIPHKSVEAPATAENNDLPDLEIEDAADLVNDNPELRREVIGELGRIGEVLTIIAMSKAQKTYLLICLALCKVAGRMFLGRFSTVPAGKVLLIDCELHKPTLARRIHAVAKALGIAESEYRGRLKVISMRGRLRNLDQLDPIIRAIPKGEYSLIIIDPLFRIYPPGINENDNAHIAAIFNQLDRYSEMTGAMFAISHHSSKGSQAAKNAMDVSAGAGSWARCVDTLIVLRPHELEDCAAVEVIARSFPPMKPFAMRWQYPLWHIDASLDGTALRQAGERGKASGAQWTPARFAAEFLNGEAVNKQTIMALASEKGLSENKRTNLFTLAMNDNLICTKRDPSDGRKLLYFKVAKLAPASPELPQERGLFPRGKDAK
jgi:hypothetical protein